MQQKIQFISTLLHEPELIIMDEPFSGLDPVNATLLIDSLVELRKSGKSILFSTHRMDQIEKMCDALALIHRGNLVLSGSMSEIKSAYPRNRVQVNFSGDSSFLRHPSIEEYKDYSGRAEIRLRTVPGVEPDAQPLLAEAVARGTRISRFEVTEPTLEEIFIEKVGAEMSSDRSGGNFDA
jgi:ABC-2 type transport system ATP-binding protein